MPQKYRLYTMYRSVTYYRLSATFRHPLLVLASIGSAATLSPAVWW
ncbi:hypothetical protein C349_00127 [Cryptococcus neoformans var. grubii Br795]|nr:hypothetical protein C354_00121 [Cryptococcus neoformans var. grubii MW-RSA1955]OXG89433.1 hypothetical protein C350_00122 [Cryptococcus neoformans var. grubii MW-RSA36]OXG94060.1 hypothetical protein C349_00127 [Cryptococcus neoformans var. grubii Br795]